LAKQREAEEKKERMKQLRQAAKATDKKQRTKYTLQNGKALCWYCKQMIDELEFDDHIVSHPTQIRHRIWLGNAENSKDMEFMTKCNITHILNCTREIDCPQDIRSRLVGFKRIAIQDKNSETILGLIQNSNHYVEEALSDPKSVLFVHCREGRSRSVSFLCAYLMWKERIAFLSALADIRSKRHIVLPNNKFYAELERFDKEVLDDRKGDQQRFGAPDPSFKLKRIKRKAIGSCMPVPSRKMKGKEKEEERDDMKGDFVEEIAAIDLDLNAQSGSPSREHHRKRSNSFHSPRSPSYGRSSVKYIGSYSAMSTGSTSMVSSPQSMATSVLSTVNEPQSDPLGDPVGDPVVEPMDDPVDDPVDEPVIDHLSAEIENGNHKKRGKSPKKSKKKKKRKSVDVEVDIDVDLNVEEALDVTDIFPPQKTKKDAKGKKKKKKKKKKSAEF